ncbi:hypothetical protein VTK56DRAFT_8807 [Thermocarpiscus australiensis]
MTLDVEKRPHRPVSLLSLPPGLRHRIYLHTGVARCDGRPYTYYLDGRKESRTVVSDFDPPPARDFAGLLLCCRALHAEAAALLYSANRFVVFYSHQGSLLEPLRALSPTSLASLTSLEIVLNESSCHQPTDSAFSPPSCCCDGREYEPWADSYRCAKYHGSLHRRPLLDPASDLDLTSAKLAAQAMLSEWRDTAAYLSSRVGVGSLELSLVCDVDPEHEYALEAARLAVAPLAVFPRLKDCHVRLCKTWDRPLQRLAQKAVLQARGNASPLYLEAAENKIPSALIDLPPEVRLCILEYTDLITPWKEVTWSRQHRGYQIRRPPCRLSREAECPPHVHNGCRLSRCDSGDSGPDPAPSFPGCFCRRRHAAFSVTCNCWAPPTDLFLICRALCRDAQFVFFSGNRFIVRDFHATLPWDLPAGTGRYYYPYERFAASEFLRDIVPAHCLADLRFLELAIHPYVPHGWPHNEHTPVLDWRATVDWLRAKINAPALTIRLVMADFIGPVKGRKVLTEKQGAEILKGYARVMGPLRHLVRKDDGLAGFYVQAAYPWRWTQKTRRQIEEHGEQWLAEAEQDLKERCERYVRGRDASLDSRTRAEPRASVWQRQYEGYSYG